MCNFNVPFDFECLCIVLCVCVGVCVCWFVCMDVCVCALFYIEHFQIKFRMQLMPNGYVHVKGIPEYGKCVRVVDVVIIFEFVFICHTEKEKWLNLNRTTSIYHTMQTNKNESSKRKSKIIIPSHAARKRICHSFMKINHFSTPKAITFYLSWKC